jgi:transcriptional regulator with XRE-family HTH domain
MSTKTTAETLDFLDRLTGSKLTFGNMIASIRKSEDMSLSEFAKELGISHHSLSDIEHARRNVSVSAAYQYAEKLGYPPKLFVALTLQNQVDQAGINLNVNVVEQTEHIPFSST